MEAKLVWISSSSPSLEPHTPINLESAVSLHLMRTNCWMLSIYIYIYIYQSIEVTTTACNTNMCSNVCCSRFFEAYSIQSYGAIVDCRRRSTILFICCLFRFMQRIILAFCTQMHIINRIRFLSVSPNNEWERVAIETQHK